jgi:hypothetical protein
MAITTLRPLRPRRAILLRKDAQLGLFGGETEVKPTAAAKRRERMLQPKAPPKPPKPSTRATAPKEGDTRINRAGNEEVLRAGRWRLASNPKVVAKDRGSAAIVPVVEAEKPMPEVDEDAIAPAVEESSKSRGPVVHAIAYAKPIQRAHVRGGGRYWKPELADDEVLHEQTITEWQIVPSWGVHETGIDAIRRYVTEMDPDIPLNAPDSSIRKHWNGMRRSHNVKLVKVRPDELPPELKAKLDDAQADKEKRNRRPVRPETTTRVVYEDDDVTVEKLGQHAYKEHNPHYWNNFLRDVSTQLRSGRNMTSSVNNAASMGNIYGESFRVKSDTPLKRFRIDKQITPDVLLQEALGKLSESDVQAIMDISDPIQQMSEIGKVRGSGGPEQTLISAGYQALGAALYLSKKGDRKTVGDVTYELSGEPLRWHRVDEGAIAPAVEEPMVELSQEAKWEAMASIRGRDEESMKLYQSKLNEMSRQEKKDYFAWKEKRDRKAAATARGKRAAETRKRRKTQLDADTAEKMQTPEGRLNLEVEREQEKRQKQYKEFGWVDTMLPMEYQGPIRDSDPPEIKERKRRIQQIDDKIERASYSWRMRQAADNPAPGEVRYNDDQWSDLAEQLSSGPAPTSAARQNGIPWKIRVNRGHSFVDLVVTGAAIRDGDNKNERYIQITTTEDIALDDSGRWSPTSSGGYRIYFQGGDPELSRKARRLIREIAEGKARHVLHEELEAILSGKELHPRYQRLSSEIDRGKHHLPMPASMVEPEPDAVPAEVVDDAPEMVDEDLEAGGDEIAPAVDEPTAVPAEVVDDAPKPTKLGDRIRAIANDLRDENDEQKKIAARILGAAAQMAQNYDNLVGEVVDMVGEDLSEDIRSLNPDATQADVKMVARDGGNEPPPTRLADKMKAIADDLRNETNKQVKATARILDAAAQIAQNYDNLVDEVAEMVGEDLEAGGGAIAAAVEESTPKVERHPDKTPWLYTAVEYQYAKNVPLPMLGEISPLQLGRMSKRQREQYLKENVKKWEASARIKQEWRDKVWQAYQNGEFRLEDVPKSSSKGLFDVNAKELISIREVAQKKADEERLINEAREENQIKDVSQVEIGDRIYHPIFKRYGIVEKKFKNSIRVLDENGDIYKVDARVAQWRSYDDMKEAALNGEAMRPPTPVLPEEEVKPKAKAKAKPKITNVTNSEFWGDSLSSKTDLMIEARRAAEKLGQRSPTVDRLYVLEEKISQQPDPENYRIIRIKGRETSYAAIYEPPLTKSLPPGPVFTLMGVPYIFDPNRAVFLRKAGTSWEQFVADLSKEADGDPCWEGYEAVGMKEKRGKMVPNCVPIN